MSEDAIDTISPAEDGSGFEERADHITEDVLRNGTVKEDWFDQIYRALIQRGTVYVIGPRGCGKTHMMRYAWLNCCEDSRNPLAIYVSFNRYLRLEPLLKTRNDALSLFQLWVLCRILLAADDTAVRISKEGQKHDIFAGFGLARADLEQLVARLERAAGLSAEADEKVASISIEGVAAALDRLCKALKRKRVVVLLDDAALVFTPEFLAEFFDVVRVLKRPNISPKCSVYPGTTEYGPRFHADHEGHFVPAWLSIDHPKYRDIMRNIGERRYPEGVKAAGDTNELLMYGSFGVPRAYLTLLRKVKETGVSQQSVNRAIQEHRDGRLNEFQSLKLKMPRFASLIGVGSLFFDKAVEALRQENEKSTETKQLLLGIDKAELDPYSSRMLALLVEAGLLFEHSEVSHGPERKYRRFTPHMAALIAARAFSDRSRGTSSTQIVSYLQRRSAKHPVRRSFKTLVPASPVPLGFDLPPCQNCGTPRINDQQKFCHNCGTRLTDDSTFTKLMSVPISELPNLSQWRRDRVLELGIRTVGEFLALSDPGTELRKIKGVGKKRAEQTITMVEAYIDEFLS